MTENQNNSSDASCREIGRDDLTQELQASTLPVNINIQDCYNKEVTEFLNSSCKAASKSKKKLPATNKKASLPQRAQNGGVLNSSKKMNTMNTYIEERKKIMEGMMFTEDECSRNQLRDASKLQVSSRLRDDSKLLDAAEPDVDTMRYPAKLNDQTGVETCMQANQQTAETYIKHEENRKQLVNEKRVFAKSQQLKKTAN